MKEVDLAARVMDWLKLEGWDVHQEVWGADIVAVKNATSWIIECKLGLGLDVLGQAYDWTTRNGKRQAVNLVSVAVRSGKWCRSRQFGQQVAEHYKIGVIEVGRDSEPTWDDGVGVMQVVHPECFIVDPARDIRQALCEETRTFGIAGSPGGACWTSFKATAKQVVEYVTAHPGCTTREIVDNIEHHYASDYGARSAIVDSVRRRWITGIELTDGRPMRWQLAE